MSLDNTPANIETQARRCAPVGSSSPSYIHRLARTIGGRASQVRKSAEACKEFCLPLLCYAGSSINDTQLDPYRLLVVLIVNQLCFKTHDVAFCRLRERNEMRY